VTVPPPSTAPKLQNHDTAVVVFFSRTHCLISSYCSRVLLVITVASLGVAFSFQMIQANVRNRAPCSLAYCRFLLG
jgi:hypothetical protein